MKLTPPQNVTDRIAEWQQKHPDWRIEAEARWFVRAFDDRGFVVEATHLPDGGIK